MERNVSFFLVVNNFFMLDLAREISKVEDVFIIALDDQNRESLEQKIGTIDCDSRKAEYYDFMQSVFVERPGNLVELVSEMGRKTLWITETVFFNDYNQKSMINRTLSIFIDQISCKLGINHINYIDSAYSFHDHFHCVGVRNEKKRMIIIPNLLHKPQSGRTDLSEYCLMLTNWFVEWIMLRYPDYFLENRLQLLVDFNKEICYLPDRIIVKSIIKMYGGKEQDDENIFIQNSGKVKLVDFLSQLFQTSKEIEIVCSESEKNLSFVSKLFNNFFYRKISCIINEHDTHENEKYNFVNVFADAEDYAINKFKFDKKITKKLSLSPFIKKRTSGEGKGKLTYYAGGKGSPIIIINAFGAHVEAWGRLIDELIKISYVIIWETRGVFDEERINDINEFSIRSQVKDIETIIKKEKIDQFSIIAWCSGVKAALVFSNLHKEKVNSLIILAGDFAPYKGCKENDSKFRENISLIRKIISGNKNLLSLYIKLISDGKNNNPQKRPIYDMEKNIFEIIPEIYRDALLEQYSSYEKSVNFFKICIDYYNFDVTKCIDAFERPVLLLCGEYDNVAGGTQSEWAQDRFEDSKYVKIEMGGHLVAIENYFEIIDELIEHLRYVRLVSGERDIKNEKD